MRPHVYSHCMCVHVQCTSTLQVHMLDSLGGVGGCGFGPTEGGELLEHEAPVMKEEARNMS